MTKRGWIIGSILLVLILIIIGSTQKSATGGAGTIKIGLIAPLTGDLAFIGEAAKHAAELAIDEVNDDASNKYKYALVVEDDAFNAKKSASAVSKLINIDRVNAVISIASNGGNVVNPIAEQNNIPHIGLASDPNVANGAYNFIHWTRPQEEVDAMLTELNKRGLKKVALMGVKQQGVKAIFDDFKSKATSKGVTVISDESFNPGEKDFKTIITAVQQTNPDVYILGAFSPEIEILAKQMKDLGVQQPLTSIETFGLSNTPSTFEGYWFVDAAAENATFGDAYKAKFNKEVGPASGNTYDAIKLFVQAIEDTNTSQPTGTQIAEKLSKINNYSGAFGKLSITPEGIFTSQASIKIIKDGKAILAK